MENKIRIKPTKKEVREPERFIGNSNISSYPWTLCHHLQSPEKDASCSCGYRGGIGGGDGKGLICEMGTTIIKGEESLTLPNYPREQELANAKLISVAPELLEFLLHINNKKTFHQGDFDTVKQLIKKAI